MGIKDKLAAVALAASFVVPAVGPARAAENTDPVAQNLATELVDAGYRNVEVGNKVAGGCDGKANQGTYQVEAINKEGKPVSGPASYSYARGLIAPLRYLH